jgi:GTPase SAR1 family protein
MSCFSGKSKQTQKSKEIEEVIKQDKKKKVFKLLLLGTGDSGKSTFAKQMQILHTKGFTDEKLKSNVPILRMNTLDTVKILITACRDWGIEFTTDENELVEEIMPAQYLTESNARQITVIWNSEAVQKAFQQKHRIQLPGGASTTEYYMENSERFAAEDFVPNVADMLRVKIKTLGVVETNFQVNGSDFLMVDVGGQRSERKKWLSCFNDVAAVIYLVALNEYDMLMEEDDRTNRMEESLKLFQKLSGSQWLRETPMILFLNKSDIFETKIQTRPLSQCFQDYEEFAKKSNRDTEFEKSCDYIKEQYSRVFNGSRLYSFITCALDTKNCEKVFLAVRDAVMAKVFQNNF